MKNSKINLQHSILSTKKQAFISVAKQLTKALLLVIKCRKFCFQRFSSAFQFYFDSCATFNNFRYWRKSSCLSMTCDVTPFFTLFYPILYFKFICELVLCRHFYTFISAFIGYHNRFRSCLNFFCILHFCSKTLLVTLDVKHNRQKFKALSKIWTNKVGKLNV